MTKSAYIDELTLITIPFSEVDEELSNFTITDTNNGENLTIEKWLKSEERWRYELYLTEPISFGRKYNVIANENILFHLKIGQVVRTVSFDELFFYDQDDLGVTYTNQSSTFKLWAPTATKVELLLYENDTRKTYPLKREAKGIWQLTIQNDLEGAIYTYRLCIDGEWREAVDPYAKAVTINGEKGVVVNLSKTNPEGWLKTPKPLLKKETDTIIYELHIRDFSIDENSGIKSKGIYEGLTETKTKGPWQTTTGLDYLVDLGITHVQWLPIQDYGSVDETEPLKTYNWGYDTIHYNALEGSYSFDPNDPNLRILELKKAVQSCHSIGLRVILDVVYNHVYIHEKSNFEKIVPGYYFRYKEDGRLADGTGVGNDIASERKMVRKFIVDSVVYLASEYDVDGFRFDLMGILDIETMQQIRQSLNEVDPSILIIGEGWDLDTPLAHHQKAIIANAEQLQGISFFNDQFRDKLKGSIFDHDKKGFCNGNGQFKEEVKMLVSGSTKEFCAIEGLFNDPYQSVNYVECHDNHTLWDKLTLSNHDQGDETRAKIHRLATAMTILSQGIPFLHAGQEFFRTKQGVENSYCSPDEINKIDWKRKALHMDNVDYVKGLIALRRNNDVFRLRDKEAVKKNMFILDTPTQCIAYMLKNSNGMFVVMHNASEEEKEIILPASGKWEVFVEEDVATATSVNVLEASKTIIKGLSTTVLYHPKI
ncbi:type I pullulanase [Anaerobacillus arseniciselenatis]|uniref:Type I pullulanase n=1 Tax=Anaerobacillus arseniciselenatis TaxID=85682 RepID=A0A1S2LAB7_9BACI|nr:type I pullulanase [Anaerobacillus arseniciselenatis]OIJ09264.1 type I pullulanase [Anaerobacillus arseniciselenatis]